LDGKALTPETIQQAAEAAGDGATPLSGNDYKVKLARVAVKRALLEASGKG
jgi:CO/xanthine dehydrogenase FAD-binding subunit